MLATLERTYLSILRVVILVAATIALILAGIGLISAVPPLLRWSGITETAQPSGGSLRDFISEQKITETSAATMDSPAAEPFTLPDIKAASDIIYNYLGKRGSVTQIQWQAALQAYADQIAGKSTVYAESVKVLAQQLKTSKGKPLSQTRIVELIDWHKARFQADVEARAAAEAEANAKFWVTIGGAGAAFLVFVLIIFVFLFVKIERSLRLVHTVHTQPMMENNNV